MNAGLLVLAVSTGIRVAATVTVISVAVAIVTAAGMLNALEIQGKKLADSRIVCLGAGAAAIACMELLIKCGAQREHIYMLDSKGVIHTRRDDLNEYKQLFANNTDKRTLEEVIEGAYYHYVHGLKKHLGNCQRIAHGHRSPIRIDRNGHRAYDLEERWAKLWQDIYVGTEEDVARRFVGEDGIGYITFEYEANQGEFALTLPEHRVYMLETDTTVELIAAHIADKLKAEFSGEEIQVKAYEGVGKGAIAIRA